MSVPSAGTSKGTEHRVMNDVYRQKTKVIQPEEGLNDLYYCFIYIKDELSNVTSQQGY